MDYLMRENAPLRAEEGAKLDSLVVEAGAQNMDLAVGADLRVAYLGNQELDHLFRVLESVALRLKRPEAVAVIGG